jgi:protease-4
MRRTLIFASAVALALLVPPAARAEKAAKKEKAGTLAHVKLSGDLGEKAPADADPLLGAAAGETFKMTIDRFKKAAADKEVKALVLEIDGLSVGWGKLHELTQAIERVRKSGKKVYAWLESGSSKDYLLALACDEVAMPESGALMLTGVSMQVTFYKGLFEKLGIKADMLQMGAFKGAAEPYTRESLSDENRKQMTSVLDDFFEKDVVARIVAGRASRKLTADKVKKLIDDGPYAAREAQKVGLIDKLAYLDDYLDTARGTASPDMKLVRDYGKKKDEELDLFGMVRKMIFGGAKSALPASRTSKIAVIYVTGAITTGKSSVSFMGGETCGSETLVKAIRQAEEDKTVKAIVLRVDSPGGSALASDLIWKELKRSKKPVIASMSDVAASGGYYVCMSAKKIYAEPGTITGSIGVVGGKLATAGLYDKVGIKTERLSRGKNAGILSSDEPFSETEKKRMTDLMKDVYDLFLTKALEGRKAAGKEITREKLEKDLAGGRIWTGRQAKGHGLIDELGTLEDAIAEAARQGGLPADKEPELLLLPKPRNPLESLLGSVGGLQTHGLKIDLRQIPQLSEKLRGVDALLALKSEPVWVVMPYQVEVK